MKMRTAALGFILCLAGFFADPATARAADVNCSGMTLTGIIHGNVVVPNGASCTIGNSYIGAKISGNVIVTQNATLIVRAQQYPSTIGGNVEANGCATSTTSTARRKS